MFLLRRLVAPITQTARDPSPPYILWKVNRVNNLQGGKRRLQGACKYLILKGVTHFKNYKICLSYLIEGRSDSRTEAQTAGLLITKDLPHAIPSSGEYLNHLKDLSFQQFGGKDAKMTFWKLSPLFSTWSRYYLSLIPRKLLILRSGQMTFRPKILRKKVFSLYFQQLTNFRPFFGRESSVEKRRLRQTAARHSRMEMTRHE